jgi:hypothetical protein
MPCLSTPGRALLGFTLLLLALPAPVHAEVSANHWAGAVRIGPTSLACDGTLEGTIRYNTIDDVHEYCDGVSWKQYIRTVTSGGAPSIPTTDDGYFVITDGEWDGNLGGIAGADAKCLDDLTNNDWMGKADAVSRGLLNGANVKAFLCCNNALPNVEYFFAVSGDDTKGGASFTTDALGQGPGNTQNWAGTNYFDGAKEYWAGRNFGTATAWSTTAGGSAVTQRCSTWTVNSSVTPTNGGYVGASNGTGVDRWGASLIACNLTRRLVCFVHP